MLAFTKVLRVGVPLVVFVLIVSALIALPLASTSCGESFRSLDFWERLPGSIKYFGKGHDLDSSQQTSVPSVKEVAGETVGSFRRDCSMSAIAPDLSERIGEKNLLKSQAYLGTGDRFKRFIAKAKRGDGFTIGVIGGSVSYGHGLRYDPKDPEGNKAYHQVVFDYLNDLYPAREGVSWGKYEKGKNSLINGAVPATGSDYFSSCFLNHIDENTDLVFVELGVNDELQIARYESYEMLLRGLLDMPSQPAVIAMQVPALVFGTIALGGDVHVGAAEYYDVPTISLRNAIMSNIFADHHKIGEYYAWNKAGPDPRHIGAKSHRLLGELVNAYADSQICEMGRKGLGDAAPEDIDVEPIPRLRAMSRYSADTVTAPVVPFCHTTNSEGKNKLIPLKSDGWREFSQDNKNYLLSDEPGSTIEFEFTTVVGSVDIFYVRSKTYGLGNAKCWVDDDRASAVSLSSYWTEWYSIGQRASIRKSLAPGKHVLKCEVLDKTDDPTGGKEFRIVSLMSL